MAFMLEKLDVCQKAVRLAGRIAALTEGFVTNPGRMLVVAGLVLLSLAPVVQLGVASSGGGVEPADACFENLPPGLYVTKSFVVPPDTTAAIGRKLGAAIEKLSNTYLTVQGSPIQVNLLDAKTQAGAVTIFKTISKMKSDPAFCLRNGKRVIEYVGGDVAVATKTSYELGFLKKPARIHYRLVADVATVDKADYMAFNELFNLFLTTNTRAPSREAASRISELSKRFQFGNTITLRAPQQSDAPPTYSFTPEPNKQSRVAGDSVTYSFKDPPEVLSVPYVTLTANLACDDTGVTPTDREADEALVCATPFWPVDDPQIAALAERIVAEERTTEAKVQAILEWLAPGKNIQFGGPVTGSRWGVKKVLEQKHGQCWDFADCFVTLCRASGIPCRQVGGWLYGTSGHIWAEVLVEGEGWQQVDPTGGGELQCGIYHIPYFTTETGEMPILYVSMPTINIVATE